MLDISNVANYMYTTPLTYSTASEYNNSFKNQIPFKDIDSYQFNDKHVFIFVMEGISQSEFEKQTSQIPLQDNFFKRVENQSHYYSNYYTTNQDSLSAIWTMMFSTFIPYESYNDNWNSQFGYILEEENIVNVVNYHNYSTSAAISMMNPSLILGAFEWEKNIFLQEFPINNSICVSELEYQQGCEDRVLLDDITKQIELSSQKQFLFQELIFGHGSGYLEEYDKSVFDYYNDYFNEFYNYLENEKLIEDSIIIIVSDHGAKEYLSRGIDNFKIPLVVIDSSNEKKEIDELYSHLQFKDIIFSYMNNSQIPQSPDEVFIVGQSLNSEFGYINSNNDYFLARDSLFNYYRIFNYTLESSLIRNKLAQFEYEKEYSLNKSSEKSFYCVLCERNEQMIVERRR
ncbi:MAG: sulfatase-like hydrolase/transferase [Candidatus Nanoarchaeia archaeon]